MVIGDLKFFASVKMSDVNLFKPPPTCGDIGNPCIEDSGNTRELVDNLIGKFVCNASIVLDSTDVAFADPFLILENIKQPQLHGNFVTLNREAAFD